MGIRFRKSFKIAPGVKVNLNKKSAGITLGGKGVHYTVNSSGRRTSSVGIPGTGLYYQDVKGGGRSSEAKDQSSNKRNNTSNSNDNQKLSNQSNQCSQKYNNSNNKNNVLMWILLIFLPPIGILYMWMKKKDIPQYKKQAITICAVIWTVILCIYNIYVKSPETNKKNDTYAIQQTQETTTAIDTEATTEASINDTTMNATTEQSIESTTTATEIESTVAEVIAPVVAPEPEATVEETKKEQMVWVTSKGKKYHSSSTCGNMKNAYQIPLSEALKQGYEKCSKCY